MKGRRMFIEDGYTAYFDRSIDSTTAGCRWSTKNCFPPTEGSWKGDFTHF